MMSSAYIVQAARCLYNLVGPWNADLQLAVKQQHAAGFSEAWKQLSEYNRPLTEGRIYELAAVSTALSAGPKSLWPDGCTNWAWPPQTLWAVAAEYNMAITASGFGHKRVDPCYSVDAPEASTAAPIRSFVDTLVEAVVSTKGGDRVSRDNVILVPLAKHATVAIGQLLAGPNKEAASVAVSAGAVDPLVQLAQGLFDSSIDYAVVAPALRALALLADGHTVATRESILADPAAVEWHDQFNVPLSRRGSRPWDGCTRCSSCRLVAGLTAATCGKCVAPQQAANYSPGTSSGELFNHTRTAAIGLVASLCRGSSANQIRLGRAHIAPPRSLRGNTAVLRLLDGLVGLLATATQPPSGTAPLGVQQDSVSWVQSEAPRSVDSHGLSWEQHCERQIYQNGDTNLQSMQSQNREGTLEAVAVALHRLVYRMDLNKQAVLKCGGARVLAVALACGVRPATQKSLAECISALAYNCSDAKHAFQAAGTLDILRRLCASDAPVACRKTAAITLDCILYNRLPDKNGVLTCEQQFGRRQGPQPVGRASDRGRKIRGISRIPDRFDRTGRQQPAQRGTRRSHAFRPDQLSCLPRSMPSEQRGKMRQRTRPKSPDDHIARKAVAWRKAWGKPPPAVAKAIASNKNRTLRTNQRMLPRASEGFEPYLRV
eukprot:SAG31_NODE_2334_length_5929_cov_1.453516_7_plen_659_part_00